MNLLRYVTGSIRGKMLLIMFSLMLAPVVITTWIEIGDLRSSFNSNAQSRIDLMKKNLSTQGKILSLQLSSQVLDNIASFNFSGNSLMLRRAVEENPDLSYIILMDASGTAYVHTLKPSLEQDKLLDAEDIFAAKQSSPAFHEFSSGEDAYLEFIVPIQVSTEPWGVLRLGFSMKPLNQEILALKQSNEQLISDVVRNTLLFVSGMLCIGMCIVVWVSGRMTRSILTLKDHAKTMAKGDFSSSTQLNIHTGDELEELADSFSSMSRELMAAYEGLEKTVELRTTELAEARDEALAATKAKGEFLATMSHEIRTPMNAIIGLNHLALKTELTSKQRDYLSKIQISAKSLLGIINDILDFSKIEAGKLDIELVEMQLDDVLTQLSDVSSELAGRKGLELHFYRDPMIPSTLIGDPLRIHQILLNLVTNAVKFTEKGEVLVRIEREDDDTLADNSLRLRFTVKDTGIGLTEEQSGRLFQSFSQADSSTTRKYGGTGLGLAICKSLVELMHGKIWVESTPGRGSSFIFTALFETCLDTESVTRELMPDSLSNRRILLVDDNLTPLEILTEYLRAFNFEVVTARSGSEAIHILEEASASGEKYDLVLMDYQMPGMNGVEATRIIKTSSRIKEIPMVIMVTAHNREDVVEAAEQAKIDRFLTKPVGQSLLFNTLIEVFQGSEGYVHNSSKRKAKTHAGLAAIRGARLLLVEDNIINQQVAQEILEQAGFEVFIANHGQEGFEMASSDYYDAILMDLQMPVMGGIEAAQKIRESGNRTPIIAMTAHAMKEEVERCLAAGMDDHTSKPIDSNALFSTLCRWIKPLDQTVNHGLKVTQADTATKTSEQLHDIDQWIDVQRVLESLNGNEKLLRKLLATFVGQYSGMDNRLHRAVDTGNVTQALEWLHDIKGTSGGLAATPLFEASREFEQLLLQNPDGEIRATLQTNFDACLNKTLHAMQQFLGTSAM